MTTIIAVPSELPGGLEADLSPHFGHCPVFTLVTVDGPGTERVEILPNQPHEHGGCAGPVNLLAENGVRVMVAEGMGGRPLAFFEQAGIMVVHNGGTRRVGDVVAALVEGRLQRFESHHTCGGAEHPDHDCHGQA